MAPTNEQEGIDIRVSTKTNPQALAGSISAAFSDGKDIRLYAIGPFPISQAFKAVCIANRALAPRGVMLGIIPGLETKELMDRESNQPVPWVISVMRLIDILSR